jgi:S1-C subfamily serine protease
MTTLEDLNKTQIILLTLLISFITSIATGVITTALLAEAPAGVTQTINRVVERTIEKVAPSATSTSVVKEVTVVREDDAILSSIDKVSKSVVNITVRGADGSEMFYALGAIVSKDGIVVSDGQGLILDGSYTANLSDGSKAEAKVVSRSTDQNLAIFKLTSNNPNQTYPALPLAEKDPRLGQTIVAFEGKASIAVAVGRVSSLIRDTADTDKTKAIKTVATDIPSRGETAGGPLVSLSGELIGIKSSAVDLTVPPGIYTATDQIRAQLALPATR